MIKKSFTSRGYSYHLLDHIQFGDKYFDKSETFSSEYLIECLNAGVVLRVREEDNFYFYISPTATVDDLEEEVRLHLTEDFPEETINPKIIELIKEEKYSSVKEIIEDSEYATLYTSYLVTENLWILHSKKHLKTNLI